MDGGDKFGPVLNRGSSIASREKNRVNLVVRRKAMSSLSDEARARIESRHSAADKKASDAERWLRQIESWISEYSKEFAASNPPTRTPKKGWFGGSEPIAWNVSIRVSLLEGVSFIDIRVQPDGGWTYLSQRTDVKGKKVAEHREWIKRTFDPNRSRPERFEVRNAFVECLQGIMNAAESA